MYEEYIREYIIERNVSFSEFSSIYLINELSRIITRKKFREGSPYTSFRHAELIRNSKEATNKALMGYVDRDKLNEVRHSFGLYNYLVDSKSVDDLIVKWESKVNIPEDIYLKVTYLQYIELIKSTKCE